MRRTINIFYMLLMIACMTNTNIVTLNRYNMFEIVCNIEKTVVNKVNKVKKIKAKFFVSFLHITKKIQNLIVKYIVFSNYDKLNLMISLE